MKNVYQESIDRRMWKLQKVVFSVVQIFLFQGPSKSVDSSEKQKTGCLPTPFSHNKQIEVREAAKKKSYFLCGPAWPDTGYPAK